MTNSDFEQEIANLAVCGVATILSCMGDHESAKTLRRVVFNANGMQAFDHAGNLVLELGSERRSICISCGAQVNKDGSLPCDH
ncbi:hypothetical protein PAN31117_03125 [Pandoraea anapnoica]|uniref:Uncharacterized protein n=1 Tax=Pandoraea anapnoica TaxID=2508301 RepID=A0A5E5A7V3_9BURK|nr:hypothetical protein [Pandoraea anapnoica]VVE68892.1 hypothetical protein PAN31117_03125 [Pandoraea anapnoica]